METKTFTLQMQENAEYIFERYKGLIYKIARDILDDSLLAEDCLQEVVLKLTLLPGKLNTDEYEYPYRRKKPSLGYAEKAKAGTADGRC